MMIFCLLHQHSKNEMSKKKKNRPKILPNFIAFLLLFSPGNAQFGEIASVVSSLLAGGGGAGLAGLGSAAGSGASLGSLGSLGAGAASAGAGAAGAGNAIGNIGTLYQLAQAALQLTGTGVGIANQASESAWFPAVVESAAKMNRDFQDRLLHGTQGGGLGTLGGLGGVGTKSSKGSGSIGKEYGKEFGSGEEGETETNSLLGGLPSGSDSSSSIFSSRVSLLPNLLPMGQIITPSPPSLGIVGIGEDRARTAAGNGLPGLPGLGRLLPGESTGLGGGGEGESSRIGGGIEGTIASRKKLIGIGQIEEVPLSPPIGESQSNFEGIGHQMEGAASLLPGESPIKPSQSSSESFSSISSPKITVKLPPADSNEGIGGRIGGNLEAEDVTKKKAIETTIEQIETEFSTDNEGKIEEEMQQIKQDETEEHGLEPLIPSDGNQTSPLNMTRIEQIAEHRGFAQMVPELRKLIGQLKMGNLTIGELEELERQLANNIGVGEPRENTERAASEHHNRREQNERNSDEESNRERTKTGEIVNEHRQRASNRNLAALRRGLYSSSELAEQQKSTEEGPKKDNESDKLEKAGINGDGRIDALIDGQKDPILRKIVDFNRPPIILSLERSNPSANHRHLPTTFLGPQNNHRIESNVDFGQIRRESSHGARALGAPSEIVDIPKTTTESTTISTKKRQTTTESSTSTITIELGKSTTTIVVKPTMNGEIESTATTTEIVEMSPVVRAKVPIILPSSSSIMPPKYSTNAPKRKELPRAQQQVDERPKHWNEQPLKLVDSASKGNGRRPFNGIGNGLQQQAMIGPRGRGGKRPAAIQRGTQQKQVQQQNQQNRNWGRNVERGKNNNNNNNNGQWQQNGQKFVNNQQYGPNSNWQSPQNEQFQQHGNIGNGQWQQQQFGTTNWGGSQSAFGQFQQQQPTSFPFNQQQSHQQFFQPNGQPYHWTNQQTEQNWANQQQNFNQFGGFPVRTLPDPVQSTPPSLVYHPFSSGTLLTFGQSHQQQSRPEFFRFDRK